MSKANLLQLTGYFLFLVFFITVFFSLRAISSFALGGLLIWSIATGGLRSKWNAVTFFLLASSIYFIIGLITSLQLTGVENKWDHVLLQAGLLLTGLTIYLSCKSKKLDWDIIFLLLVASIGLTLLYCLFVNTIEFSKSRDSNVFFYHALVSPAKQHAVYFSIYVFAALTWLVESVKRNKLLFDKKGYIVFILFFSIALFFLASKLVLVFYMVYLLVQLFQSFIKKKAVKISGILVILLLAGIGLAVFTKNPVGERFREIVKGDIGVIRQDKYDPGDYFNGIQFRILQWKLVKEILNENRAWMGGVGAGESQELLDKKYKERNMYTGDPQRKDRGFLGYNTHNQFLEAALQNGLPGALLFLVISTLLLRMAWKKRKGGFALLFILLFVYSLTESVFETQYGIILFSFLPVFLYSKEETF